jgi:hypothetical protein
MFCFLFERGLLFCVVYLFLCVVSYCSTNATGKIPFSDRLNNNNKVTNLVMLNLWFGIQVKFMFLFVLKLLFELKSLWNSLFNHSLFFRNILFLFPPIAFTLSRFPIYEH